jgi:hypothetical protein
MRRETSTLASCLLVTLSASFAAAAGRDAVPNTVPEGSARPGEIIIKRTGVKRVTRVVTAPPVATADTASDAPSEGPGPRNVTIGYILREPQETGWGAQVYEPAYPTYPTYGGYCGYGYGLGYGYGYGSSYCGPSYLGSRSFVGSSYCAPSFGFGSRSYGSSSFSGPRIQRSFPLSRR